MSGFDARAQCCLPCCSADALGRFDMRENQDKTQNGARLRFGRLFVRWCVSSSSQPNGDARCWGKKEGKAAQGRLRRGRVFFSQKRELRFTVFWIERKVQSQRKALGVGGLANEVRRQERGCFSALCCALCLCASSSPFLPLPGLAVCLGSSYLLLRFSSPCLGRDVLSRDCLVPSLLFT